MGIDLGVGNFAAAKSANQYWNKRNAHLKSAADIVNKQKSTHMLIGLADKRNSAVKDFMHKASRSIVDMAANEDISVIVVGKNTGWKQESALSRVVNQSFVQIPHAKFIKMLTYKAARKGIAVVGTDEAYTSKTSFLDGELPVKHQPYAGKRIKGGLFRTAAGCLVNADINGAAQILRKVFPGAFAEGIGGVSAQRCAVSWFRPVIINLD
jgi:putative transposase